MGANGSTYAKPVEHASTVLPELKANLPSMTGKVVAVTGCTSGTGFVLAKTCAELGAQVIMINRPSKRSDSAWEAIRKAVPTASLIRINCDLASFSSVRDAGNKLRYQCGATGLDVLCNNAGIMAVKDEATDDGFDVQMQVNHLSHFLLTAEAWPLLQLAASTRGEARVVNHSSEMRRGKILQSDYFRQNGGNLGGDKPGWFPFSGARWERYQQAKLANVAFTYALHDRLKAVDSKVKALVAHPGLASTNLQVTTANEGGMGQGFAEWLATYGAQSAEDGAAGIITCCCAKDVEGGGDVASGQFWGPRGITGAAVSLGEESLADKKTRASLWADSNWATNAQFNP